MRKLFIFQKALAACLFLSASVHSFAQDFCFDDASKRTGINKMLLMAIASVESSFNPRAVNVNKNGTEDIGVMQINSVHQKRLSELGIQRDNLFDACLNIHVGALILREAIERHGFTWKAIGSYNVGYKEGPDKDRLRQIYAKKIWTKYLVLTKA